MSRAGESDEPMRVAMFAGLLLFAAAMGAAEVPPAPAASLLLPRFEVGMENATVVTTFTVTNTSALPRIVRVKLHTDRGYALVWYSTAMLPHETMRVNLRRMLFEGRFDQRPVPPENQKAADPLHVCGGGEHSGDMGMLLAPVVYMLTSGCEAGIIPCTAAMGHRHAHAIGYAEVDLMTTCSTGEDTPRLDDAVLTGTFEQHAGGLLVASGPLVPLPAPSSVTLRVPAGKHDVVVWREPPGHVACGEGAPDVIEVRHIDAKRAQTLTFRGAHVWAMVTEPMPADPAAAEPPPGCPAVPVF